MRAYLKRVERRYCAFENGEFTIPAWVEVLVEKALRGEWECLRTRR